MRVVALTPKPYFVRFRTFWSVRRNRPTLQTAQEWSAVRIPGCTDRGRPRGQQIQQKEPRVVAQLAELQLLPAPRAGSHGSAPRCASHPTLLRAARDRHTCLTVLLCFRTAVLQPRSTATRRQTTSPTSGGGRCKLSASGLRIKMVSAATKVRSPLYCTDPCSPPPGTM